MLKGYHKGEPLLFTPSFHQPSNSSQAHLPPMRTPVQRGRQLSEDTQQGKWQPWCRTQTHPQSQPRQTGGPGPVANTQNFCQLLSRLVAGPALGRGWGLWAVETKRSLAQSLPGRQHQALPEAPRGQGGPGGSAWRPDSGAPQPALPSPSTSHPGPGGAGPGSPARGGADWLRFQIWPRPGPGARAQLTRFSGGSYGEH